ncbi:MAG: sialidase family protein, partial [Actinomycetota bacterium]
MTRLVRGRRILLGAAPLSLVAMLAGPIRAGETVPARCELAARARAPMSAAGLRGLEMLCSEDLERDGGPAPMPRSTGEEGGTKGKAAANVRVNDPLADPAVEDGTHITQSEVSVAYSGEGAVIGYNDSTHIFDGGSVSLTGYAHSSDGGATWQDRGELQSAGGTSLVIGDPVLAARPDGTLFFANLFCTGQGALDRCPVGVSTSTDGGLTFGAPSQTWPTIPPSSFADKPWMAVDDSPTSPRSGRVYVAWANFSSTTGDSPIMLTSSADGSTWSPPVTVSDPTCAPGAGMPHAAQGIQLDVATNGDLYASWWCFGDTSFSIRFDRSTDGGLTWGTDRIVASFTEPSGDAIIDCGPPGSPSFTIVYRGNIRWNDLPSMTVNPQTGSIHLVWTQDPDGFGSGVDDAAVYHSRSTDGGSTWSAPVILGSHATDQFFPVVRASSSGTVAVNW